MRNFIRRTAAALAVLCMAALLLGTPTEAEERTYSAGGEAVGYYAGWAAYQGFTPDQIPAEHLTQINYAFAQIDPDTLTIALENPAHDQKNLAALRKLRQQNQHLKLLISVGGWSDSQYFSDAAATAARRESFAASCVDFVVEQGLDVGFAYDGDADRCLCVDEKGNVITGDHILYIYGCYMKERGKLLTNTVVTTVMSNFGLYKAFDEQGIGYAKTAVGDKYVYEYMARNGCRIGGEQSGHIIFSKYASTGDGILTSLKMMEVMLAKKKPLSALAAPLKIYPQVLENVRVTDKKAAQDDAAVQAAVKAVAEALGDTGRILVRESGTEPVVRVMVEAPDHDTCQKYVSQVVDVIKAQGYSV